MGVTHTTLTSYGNGIRRIERIEAEFDSSYTAGGESLGPSDTGLDEIESVSLTAGATAGGYIPRWDEEAGAILMYQGGGADTALTEVGDGSDLSGESVVLSVIGRS